MKEWKTEEKFKMWERQNNGHIFLAAADLESRYSIFHSKYGKYFVG